MVPENPPPVRSARTKGVSWQPNSPRCSAVRQFVVWGSVIGRDGDEARITDHIDHDVQPYRHDALLPNAKLAMAHPVPAHFDGQTRRRAWLATAWSQASTPERGPAGSVHRVGQGRLVILFAFAFELLLGFPEAGDARCYFGAVARKSLFLLVRHRLRSCLIRTRHHWRVRMGRECGSEVAAPVIASPMRTNAVDKLWRVRRPPSSRWRQAKEHLMRHPEDAHAAPPGRAHRSGNPNGRAIVGAAQQLRKCQR